MMMPGNGLITLAGARIQEKRRPKRTPFFFGSRFANGLEIEQILLAELEGIALPREGHDPLKHKSSQMYRYLENANLGDAPAVVYVSVTNRAAALYNGDGNDQIRVLWAKHARACP